MTVKIQIPSLEEMEAYVPILKFSRGDLPISARKKRIHQRFGRLLRPFFQMVDEEFSKETSAAFWRSFLSCIVEDFNNELFRGISDEAKFCEMMLINCENVHGQEFNDYQAYHFLLFEKKISSGEESRSRLCEIRQKIFQLRVPAKRRDLLKFNWLTEHGDFVPSQSDVSEIANLSNLGLLIVERLLLREVAHIVSLQSGYSEHENTKRKSKHGKYVYPENCFFSECAACQNVYPTGGRLSKKKTCSNKCNGALQRNERKNR